MGVEIQASEALTFYKLQTYTGIYMPLPLQSEPGTVESFGPDERFDLIRSTGEFKLQAEGDREQLGSASDENLLALLSQALEEYRRLPQVDRENILQDWRGSNMAHLEIDDLGKKPEKYAKTEWILQRETELSRVQKEQMREMSRIADSAAMWEHFLTGQPEIIEEEQRLEEKIASSREQLEQLGNDGVVQGDLLASLRRDGFRKMEEELAEFRRKNIPAVLLGGSETVRVPMTDLGRGFKRFERDSVDFVRRNPNAQDLAGFVGRTLDKQAAVLPGLNSYMLDKAD